METLTKIAEMGPTTVIALVLLVFMLLVVYLIVFLFPRCHRQAMDAFANLTQAINASTQEHRQSRHEDRHVAEVRHAEVLTKLEAIHKDFLSDADKPAPAAAANRPVEKFA